VEWQGTKQAGEGKDTERKRGVLTRWGGGGSGLVRTEQKRSHQGGVPVGNVLRKSLIVVTQGLVQQQKKKVETE